MEEAHNCHRMTTMTTTRLRDPLEQRVRGAARGARVERAARRRVRRDELARNANDSCDGLVVKGSNHPSVPRHAETRASSTRGSRARASLSPHAIARIRSATASRATSAALASGRNGSTALRSAARPPPPPPLRLPSEVAAAAPRECHSSSSRSRN